jgi:hypothetical protein
MYFVPRHLQLAAGSRHGSSHLQQFLGCEANNNHNSSTESLWASQGFTLHRHNSTGAAGCTATCALAMHIICPKSSFATEVPLTPASKGLQAACFSMYVLMSERGRRAAQCTEADLMSTTPSAKIAFGSLHASCANTGVSRGQSTGMEYSMLIDCVVLSCIFALEAQPSFHTRLPSAHKPCSLTCVSNRS